MALWMAELPSGGTVIGEAANQAEPFRMIEDQQHDQSRASVTWNEQREMWRWTVVLDGGKTRRLG